MRDALLSQIKKIRDDKNQVCSLFVYNKVISLNMNFMQPESLFELNTMFFEKQNELFYD